MCDYSLEIYDTRDAKVGDSLVASRFGSGTTGFTETGHPMVAVCLRPGTELVFEIKPKWYSIFGWPTQSTSKTARFRRIDPNYTYKHHDALEFPNGKVVMLNDLEEGQKVTVLQLPVEREFTPSKTVKRQDTVPVAEPVVEPVVEPVA